MRNALQCLAFLIILGVGLLADGLMDTLGPLGFIRTAGLAVAVAGVLVWLSNRPCKKKAAPKATTFESDARPAVIADHHTLIMGTKKGNVKYDHETRIPLDGS